jgi:hypothetical protein
VADGADGRASRRGQYTAFTPPLLLLAVSRTPIQVLSSRGREASQPAGIDLPPVVEEITICIMAR